MKTTHGLLPALGAAMLATAGDASAQRGRNNSGASSLPQVTCASGATGGSFAVAAQGALNRTLLPSLGATQKQGYYQQAFDLLGGPGEQLLADAPTPDQQHGQRQEQPQQPKPEWGAEVHAFGNDE